MTQVTVSDNNKIPQPANFEGAIGVNASALVTMATLFTSVADHLPRTAYMKLIDYWLSFQGRPDMQPYKCNQTFHRFIANLCIPMVEVLLHAIIDYTRGNDVKMFAMAKMEELKFWNKSTFWVAVARVGVPVAYLLITLAIVIPGMFNIAMSN